MKLSIIIPVYNTKKYLKRCLDSVVNQTYENLEIIIIDDGSTDGSANVCDAYLDDARCTVIHKKNEGQAAARNLGLSMATGDYLGFVDSDDYLYKDMYEKMMQCILETRSDICICNYESEIAEGERIVLTEYRDGIRSSQEGMLELLEDKTFKSFLWNKIFKKELFRDIQFSIGRVMEDYAIMPTVMSRANECYVMNKALYVYNQVRSDSTSNYINTKLLADIYFSNRERYYKYSKEYSELQDVMLKQYGQAVYRFLVDADKESITDKYRKDYEEAKKDIRNNLFRLLKCNMIEKKFRCELLLYSVAPKTYIRVRKKWQER